MKGYVHVYTGNGKGKTTAAIGLAIRAAGAGMRVYIAQFVKGMHYSELDALDRYADRITLKQYGRDCFIEKEPEEEDIQAARQGLEEVKGILASGDYQMVILDEANIATRYNLFSPDELIEARPIEARVHGTRHHRAECGPEGRRPGGPGHRDERDQALLQQGRSGPPRNRDLKALN